MLIDTVDKFEKVKEDLLTCLCPAVDTETNGLNPWGTLNAPGHRIIGISIDTGNQAYYFPYRHLAGVNLPASTFEFFKKYLSNPDRTYRGFNYKFDMQMLYQDGVPYAACIEDVMLAVHLLNENEVNFKLKSLGDRYIGNDSSLDESVLMNKLEVITNGKVSSESLKGMMCLLPPGDVEAYACQDVILTNNLIDICVPALKHWGLYDMWKEINYYSNITCDMETRGMLIDYDLMMKYNSEASVNLAKSMEHLSSLAGIPVNPNSSPQVCKLLGVESSAHEILEVISEWGDEKSEIAKAVIDARGWKSVGSRYYIPYSIACDGEHVLRTSLNLIGTISGRLSSSNPNLQAVARQTDVFKVKDVFIARDGYTLISADYAQAEMRLACFYSGEETMANNIRNGLDTHSVTADNLGIPRDAAKRINFGVIYGIGKVALARQLRIDESVAAEYLKKYHGMYPMFRKFLYACEKSAEKNGFIRMWTGRVRRYDCNNPSHKAMSNLIQGGVAEIMRVSISKLKPFITDVNGFMLLQIHDQVIFEVPDENIEVSIPVIKHIMEDFDFDPPMVVDMKCGKSWGGMSKC